MVSDGSASGIIIPDKISVKPFQPHGHSAPPPPTQLPASMMEQAQAAQMAAAQQYYSSPMAGVDVNGNPIGAMDPGMATAAELGAHAGYAAASGDLSAAHASSAHMSAYGAGADGAGSSAGMAAAARKYSAQSLSGVSGVQSVATGGMSATASHMAMHQRVPEQYQRVPEQYQPNVRYGHTDGPSASAFMPNVIHSGNINPPAPGQIFGSDGKKMPRLRLRGLPFTSSEHEILDFFESQGLYRDRIETLEILRKADNRPSGQCRVFLKGSDPSVAYTFQEMLQWKWIGQRYIEVFVEAEDGTTGPPTHGYKSREDLGETENLLP